MNNNHIIVNNTTWYILDLLTYINNSQIKKPKFQRQKKWRNLPVDDNGKPNNKPNYKQYIEFLFKTKNSIDPISFGKQIDHNTTIYYNVDGNNRINAIIEFIKKPLYLFKENLNDLYTFIDNELDNIEDPNKQLLKDFIYNLDYQTLFDFRSVSDLYENHFTSETDKKTDTEIENIFLTISRKHDKQFSKLLNIVRSKLCFGPNGNFKNEVKINVNIFENTNFTELCQIFESINKHNNSLTPSELLASMLYSKEYTVEDKTLDTAIRLEIKKYYDERDNSEVLEGYHISEIYNFNLNAFDIIIGLENYCFAKYDGIVPKYDPNESNVFFKLYKYLYQDDKSFELDPNDNKVFNKENINDFVVKVKKAVEVLHNCINEMFPKNIDETLFTKKTQKQYLKLPTNPLLVIIITIIYGFQKKNIENAIQKCILYHFMVKDIDKSLHMDLYNDDFINYQLSRSYSTIETGVKKIKEDPLSICEKITKKSFTKLLEILIKNINIPNDNNDKPSRRKLNFVEKCLTSYYYKKCVSQQYLDNQYSIEHIIPYSVRWEDGKLDINRLGNLTPIINNLNCGRGNNHIEYYYNKDPIYTSLIRSIPNIKDYNKIVEHNTSKNNIKLKIISIDEYDKMCTKNEKMYIDNFINTIFE